VGDTAAAAAAQGTPPPFPAERGCEEAPGSAVVRDSEAGGGGDDGEDAVTVVLAALGALATERGRRHCRRFGQGRCRGLAG